jgi:phage/plasmid-associated DNA primase
MVLSAWSRMAIASRVRAFDEAIVEMRDLASPVAAFVRQRCIIDKNRSIKVDDLYAAYKTWADAHGTGLSVKKHLGATCGRLFPVCVSRICNGAATSAGSTKASISIRTEGSHERS